MLAEEGRAERLVRSPLSYAQHILRLSDEMYQHAKQAEWLMFTEREIMRQKLISSLFAHPQIAAELESLQTILRQVMEIDNKSILLGDREKQRLGREVSGFKQHRQAAQVYQLVSMN